MATSAANLPTTSPARDGSRGRGYFWVGIGLCLLGLVLAVVQLGLKYLFVPWYSPALATLGAVFLLLSAASRRSISRVAGLLLVTAFAGLQWYFLVSLMKLPEYHGPAQPGKQLPHFQAIYADGRPFTEADLSDGSRRVLAFFRGRW